MKKKKTSIKFPMYCFDMETTPLDLSCVKIIKKDCSTLIKHNSTLIKHNSICLPNYTKE